MIKKAFEIAEGFSKEIVERLNKYIRVYPSVRQTKWQKNMRSERQKDNSKHITLDLKNPSLR